MDIVSDLDYIIDLDCPRTFGGLYRTVQGRWGDYIIDFILSKEVGGLYHRRAEEECNKEGISIIGGRKGRGCRLRGMLLAAYICVRATVCSGNR